LLDETFGPVYLTEKVFSYMKKKIKIKTHGIVKPLHSLFHSESKMDSVKGRSKK
jgi:hypothetical protein